jgi:aldehyde dehydrogenase (NAD+)
LLKERARMSATESHHPSHANCAPAALIGRYLADGKLAQAIDRGVFAVENPASGMSVGEAALCLAADVAVAVDAARRAQRHWADTTVRERSRLLVACARLLETQVEELARLCTLETGKAIRTESRPEALELSGIFSFFAGLAGEAKGETIPFAPNVLSLSIREPLGVVGAIVPWNAPLLLAALKIAPALATGNTVVVKTSEFAPFAVLRMAELLARVLPPGVLNVVSGQGHQAGAALVAHPDVAGVSFTGGVETGRTVYRAASEKIIPVTLELGGKSPMIVFADCDLDRAVEGALTSMRFTRQGQSCTAASRIYVQRPRLTAFVRKLTARLDGLRIGDPLHEETDVGPMISLRQKAKVEAFLAEAGCGSGVELMACGNFVGADVAKGAFMKLFVVTGTTHADRIVREEIFGPVTCVMPFDGPEDVLELANDSEFGLSASVWTRDLSMAATLATRISAGIVQVNQNLVVQPNVGVGGTKSSGLGHEGTREAMVEHFTRRKSVLIRID